MPTRNSPIGIFDSGIGGLTVVKELITSLPAENITYLGDTEHLPYGSKSENAIQHFSLKNATYLMSQDAKIIVVACNTASAVALRYIRKHIDLPIIGVVESGAASAIKATKTEIIGVIGTKTTIRSKAYTQAITKLNPAIKVIEAPTPLLVHLIEENWVKHNVTIEILQEYLLPLLKENIDTLVLGCTHYPFIKEQIKRIAPNLKLVDSATATAASVARLLNEKEILTEREKCDKLEISLTDIYADTEQLASNFLGRPVFPKLVTLKEDRPPQTEPATQKYT
jgi:glutamate racemase